MLRVLIGVGLGAAAAWWIADHVKEVRATVDVLEDEIVFRPAGGTEVAEDPDAPLPLGAL